MPRVAVATPCRNGSCTVFLGETMTKSVLLVFYSDSGHTRKAIDEVATLLDAAGWRTAVELIEPLDLKRGAWGFFLRAWRAGTKRASTIAPPQHNPGDFDLVVVGSPLWGRHLSTPAQGYLKRHAAKLPPVALVATMSGSPLAPLEKDIADIIGRRPVAAVGVTDRERVHGEDGGKIASFVDGLIRDG